MKNTLLGKLYVNMKIRWKGDSSVWREAQSHLPPVQILSSPLQKKQSVEKENDENILMSSFELNEVRKKNMIMIIIIL